MAKNTNKKNILKLQKYIKKLEKKNIFIEKINNKICILK